MSKAARPNEPKADRSRRPADRFRFGRADGPGLTSRFPGMAYQCRNDRDWTMDFVSEGAVELTGYLPDEFVSEEGVVFADIIDVEDRKRVWSEVQDAVAQDRPFELEYRIRTSSGVRRWVRELGHPVWADDGDLLGLEGFIFDITPSKERAAELERTLDVLETLTEQRLFGVYVIQDGVFRYVNDRFAEIFGYSKEEIEGRLSPADLSQEEDEPRVIENIERRLQGEVRDLRYCFRGRRKDGGEVAVEVHGSRVRNANGWAISGVLLDSTEQRELEDQLRIAQKREALAEVTATVAHDFNNFLTAILGAVDLARDDLPGGSPARAPLDLAMGTVERARNLTLQLLSFSRGEPATRSRFDLNEVVDEMGLLLDQLVGSPIALELDLAARPLYVEADWSKLEQVIMNLAVNARDAMPLGGALTIRTRPVSDADEETERAEIELSDTGRGIPSDDLERVFEPFFTTKQMGTGLGLSMVRKIMEESAGGVSVQSEVDSGTTFRLWLPVVEAGGSRPAPPPKRATIPVDGSPLVLLVEDDDSVRRVVEAALERDGYRVESVRSAAAALELADRWDTSPGLVILDYSLPDRDGAALAALLRKRWEGVPLLVSSGFVSPEVLGPRLLETGADFLEKPFSLDRLLTAVEDAIGRERGSDDGA